MRITKHEHACLRIAHEGSNLVIDPGTFTAPLDDVRDVVAVVITHEHPDHWSSEQLRALLAASPEAVVLAPAGVAAKAEGFDVEVVQAGDVRQVPGFELRFFGGVHAEIHHTIPACDNLGVLVNGGLYHPGDSFAAPDDVRVDTLAAPAGAPWLKVGEVMDFIDRLRPARVVPIHDAVLSEAGKGVHYARMQEATDRAGGEFRRLEPGESIEI